MEKRYIIAGFVVLILGIALAFFYAGGFFSTKATITGNVIRYMGNGPQDVNEYLNNLEVDGITLPEGSVEPRQILVIAALKMQEQGKNMNRYSIYSSARKLAKDKPIEKFNSYYYKSDAKQYWVVSYMEKYDPYEVCIVKLKYSGEFVNFECMPASLFGKTNPSQ
ncbi:MAG: hypothetical protein Q8P57_00560 [Candidatus Pacearchaeota archaeon]|nr:hypothetical protein [Candidatus Pacearchaeota archaeon]